LVLAQILAAAADARLQEVIFMTNSMAWPALRFSEWKDTYATLHMWTQIVGKVRLALCPPINHCWGVALYVTSRGLTTSPIPYKDGSFEITFDFIAHSLEIATSGGEIRAFRLKPCTVAQFYAELMGALHSLGIDVKMWTMPVEVPRPVRFTLDDGHASYDAEYAHRFWRALVSVNNVFWEFRSRFVGKSSPVHFFWGSFDLAVTRFSGRPAPGQLGADGFMKDAYSHEVSSVGFWPGDGEVIKDAAFYAYAVPEPAGFREYRVRPEKAFYLAEKGEYFLMYDHMRLAENPAEALMEFCQSGYEAAAVAGKWDRAELERQMTSASGAGAG
jgi:hypothetical protein